MHLKKTLAFLTAISFAAPVTAQFHAAPFFRYVSADTVLAAASHRYNTYSFLNRFLMGNNYRPTWYQPVSLPVFRLSKSGFTIKELGGGMQTKSLELVDQQGKVWALRTVEKDVRGALPGLLKQTLARRVFQDFISSSLPYGSPVAGVLVAAAGIKAPRPTAYFVADDPAFGPHQALFANTVCTLEDRNHGYTETDESATVLKKLRQTANRKIQQPQLLRARLMDLLMADWDRHADNWRWGVVDSGGLQYFYAIPRDRDWVFYKSRGAVPALARLVVLPHLVNFTIEIDDLTQQAYKSWPFDRTFLTELDRSNWEAIIKEVQYRMTDVVFDEALAKLPPEVRLSQGPMLRGTLQKRREGLLEHALNYYAFLAQETMVNGSNETERYLVTGSDGRLTVSLFRIEPDGTERLRFKRQYRPEETMLVTIHSFAGNDRFDVDASAVSKIKMIIDAGLGQHTYNLNGSFKLTVKDAGNSQVSSNKMKARLRKK